MAGLWLGRKHPGSSVSHRGGRRLGAKALEVVALCLICVSHTHTSLSCWVGERWTKGVVGCAHILGFAGQGRLCTQHSLIPPVRWFLQGGGPW